MATNQKFEERLGKHMEEMRRLHDGAMRAADRVQDGADRTEKVVLELQQWTLSIQKRVEKLEILQAIITGGAIVAGAALWDKAKKILGLA